MFIVMQDSTYIAQMTYNKKTTFILGRIHQECCLYKVSYSNEIVNSLIKGMPNLYTPSFEVMD